MARRLRRAGAFVKRHHSKVTGGAKGSAVAAAVGIASYFISQKAGDALPFLREKWWATPAALAVGGHFLKRKMPTAGVALCGVAGYMGGLNYALSSAAAKAGASGLFDSSPDAGLLVSENAGSAAVPALEYGAGALIDPTPNAGDYSEAYDLQA